MLMIKHQASKSNLGTSSLTMREASMIQVHDPSGMAA